MAKTQITAEPGIPQIIISREFDAPRDLVFRAFTDPELLAQWFGLRDQTTIVDRHDLCDGGRWRYVSKDAEGNEFCFRGIFHGDQTPDGMVRTFEFEGAPGHVVLETTTLQERDGRTTVRTVSSFQSVEDRDGMVASGMERGVHESYELVTELLAKLQAG